MCITLKKRINHYPQDNAIGAIRRKNLLPLVSKNVSEGVLLGTLGEGVPPGSPNPDPISDQRMSFSTLVFRPGLYEIKSSLL